MLGRHVGAGGVDPHFHPHFGATVLKQLSPCVLAITFFLLGCGGGGSTYEGEQRAAISGVVTLDGQPVKVGTIAFIPEDSSKRRSGTTIVGGEYSLTEGKGPEFGPHQVVISAKVEDAEKVVEVLDIDGKGTGEFAPATTETIPEKYNEQTELKLEVDAADMTANFDLQSN